MDKLRIISDLHMLDKGARDDCRVEGKLIEFASDSYDKGYHLIIAGDIIDLWQKGRIDQIFDAYRSFFRLLADNSDKTTPIGGNHDHDWLGRSLEKEMWNRYNMRVYKALIIDNSDKPLNISLPSNMVPYARYKSTEPIGGLLVTHGHQFDTLASSELGWLTTALAGVAERHIWKDIDLAYYFLRKKLLPPYNYMDFIWPLVSLAQRLGVKNAVYGHVHVIGDGMYSSDVGISPCKVMNSGCWVNGSSDYVEYNDGKWKLGVW